MAENRYILVVAKYNEDISWLSNMDLTNIVVYDKGNDNTLLNYPCLHINKVPNIGRESDSYIKFIISNYKNLPDYILFVQGKPFDHMVNITPDNFQKNINELISSQPNKIKPLFASWYAEKHYEYSSIKTPEYYEYLFKNPAPQKSIFSMGCQYIVPRNSILSNPLEFYEQLHEMIQKGDSNYYNAHHGTNTFDPHRINAWTFERLGAYIFGLKEDPNMP